MFTRPDELSDEVIAAVLAEAWGITVARSDYLAIGFGSHHWAIRTRSDERWFLTVDDLVAKRHSAAEPLARSRERLQAALRTARRLRDDGLGFVVAPGPTTSGDVLAPVGPHFAAALYPWVEGRSHSYGAYTTEADRLEVVELLSALHAVDTGTVPDAGRDDFAIPNRDELTWAIDDVGRTWGTGPFADEARRLLSDRAAEVDVLLRRYDQLVETARDVPDHLAITHGEPHAANTISTAAGRLLIDWDTALIAPPERDLWMVLDDDATTAAIYAARTGNEPLAPLVEMYRMLWDLTEIAGYTAFFRAPHVDSVDATESWKNLMEYLDIERRWPLIR
jgi:hypothetical protein